MANFKLQFYLLIIVFFYSAAKDVTKEPGHMKPFGTGKPRIQIEQITGYINPKYFFDNYVKKLKPVILKDVGNISPAFNLWTDEYFLSKNFSGCENVTINPLPNGDDKVPVDLDFKTFVQTYNMSGSYMVNPVPKPLREDVVIPCSVQCLELIKRSLVADVSKIYKLFNSILEYICRGGTASVVHTDAVDNMNCVYRGYKEFFLVDPEKYKDKIDINNPESNYTDMDINRIDFTKYPVIAEIEEFYHANVSAGDCLYLPHKWIHQVRSYGSNIAVNIWWNHFHIFDIDLDKCDEVCDDTLRLSNAEFTGFEHVMDNPLAVRDYFQGLMNLSKRMDIDHLWKTLLVNDLVYIENTDFAANLLTFVQQMFDVLDIDEDKIVTFPETEKVKEQDWMKVKNILDNFEVNLDQTLDQLSTLPGFQESISHQQIQPVFHNTDEL